MSKEKKYNVIYADPPWSYNNKSIGGKFKNPDGSINLGGASDKYNTMTLDDIKKMPIKEITTKDAVLFMWATVPLLPECLEVLPEWGFKYKTMLTWRKIMSMGMGYWFRGQVEHLVLGVKGNVKAFRQQKANFHQSKAGAHSQKPHHFRELINEAVKVSFEDPVKLELFARDRNDLFPDYEYQGWDVYGNECKKSIIL